MMEIFTNYILPIGKGALVTIVVTVVSIIIGIVVGIPLAIIRTYGKKPFQIIIQGYEGFFRGTPLVVVCFIFYFGLAQLGDMVGVKWLNMNLPPFLAASLSLGLTCSAYISMIFRGSVQSISKDQYDAARSLGMGKWKAIFNVILMQALRISLPSFVNEFTIVLKDSPITYLVAIPEMFTEATGIIDASAGKVFFEILLPVSVLYFILFFLSNKLFGLVQKRLEIPGFEYKGEVA